MRFVTRMISSFALLATVTAFTNAESISPGSKAPALDVKTWYKGTPVKSFDSNKLYVVEFWATWCGPCRESIPHLTELAKKNKDVSFIGVSIWEDDKGGNIKSFVDEMGAKMDYNVGYSGNKTGMSQSWMMAAGQNGIPTAFVVKGGKIQWIGHPMELEKPLAEIKSGKFDLEGFKKDFAKQAEAAKAAQAAQQELAGVQAMIAGGKYAEAEAKLNDIDKKSPDTKYATEQFRFAILAKTSPDKWEAKAKALASGNENEKNQLCMYALEQTQGKAGDMVSAQKAMDFAVAGAKEGDALVYYYAASFADAKGDHAKALEFMDKSLAALPKSNLKDNKQALEALTKIREDYAKKAKGR